jgi:hypothetical protein
MRQIARLFLLCFILLLVLNAGAALAESPSERNCAGIFDRDHGTVSCLVEDPVGNSERSGGHSQTTKEEETSQGTFNNRPHHDESCTGPGGSGEDGGPCHNK